MAKYEFGKDLWKDVQSVRVTRNDGLQLPIRSDAEHGVSIGSPATSDSEQRQPRERHKLPWWKRLLGRS